MKCTLTAIFTFLILTNLIASPQVPDYIIYKNDTIPTYNLLVEQYLQTRNGDNGRLFDLSFRNSIDGRLGNSMNCWRGYQAMYKIEKDSLFLIAIIECHSLENKNQKPTNYIKKIFGDKVKSDKVFINWYSGNISFPEKSKENKILRWDGVFERVFLYETTIKIKNGNIIKVSNEENYIDLENGIDRMEKDSISNILFDHIKSYKWTKLDKIDCGESYTIVIGANGKISDVLLTDYQTEEQIEKYWDTKREYNFCLKSVEKALSELQFDIIKRKGKPIKEKVFIELWFNEDGTMENWTD
ncbi:hypothetical protein [Neptunitalea lumnitzerae]|uniref:Uncharacterized protein n=1 Tax=Neptunitalea lumnitzerae TaxID=2965509 RepID=A0ABQ5MJB1_9FLAO|nr:hypothetical protein [Neptunitalea sp. Y10]GLB49391.1 hypothetical protein Y10_17590 [Neptunitalea sp. Y10]